MACLATVRNGSNEGGVMPLGIPVAAHERKAAKGGASQCACHQCPDGQRPKSIYSLPSSKS